MRHYLTESCNRISEAVRWAAMAAFLAPQGLGCVHQSPRYKTPLEAAIRADREYARMAIGNLMCSADLEERDECFSDPELIFRYTREIYERYPEKFRERNGKFEELSQAISPDLWNDSGFLLELHALHISMATYASDVIYREPYNCDEASPMFSYLGNFAKLYEDKDFIIDRIKATFLSINGEEECSKRAAKRTSVELMPDEFWSDYTFLVRAVEEVPSFLNHIPDYIFEPEYDDEEFVHKPAERTLKRLQELKKWQIEKMEARAKRAQYVERAGKLGIEFLERFSDDEAESIVTNRENIEELNAKPLAILAYPKTDHNRAFEYNPFLQDLLDRYQVIYIESDSDKKLIEGLFGVAKSAKKKASLIIIAGHGSKKTLRLGGGGSDSATLDITDNELGHISHIVEEEGAIILYSCSNGEGETNSNNLANFVSAKIPHASIYSQPGTHKLRAIEHDVNGRVVEVVYGTRGSTYSIPSRSSLNAD